MPVQILPYTGGLAEAGQITGNALSNVLQDLATAKINQIQQRNQYRSTLSGLKALNVENAEQLAHLPQPFLEQIVKQKLEEPSQIAYANALQSLLGGEAMQPQKPELPKQSALPSITPNQKQQLESYLQTPQAKAKHNEAKIKQVQDLLRRPVVTAPEAVAPVAPRVSKPGVPNLSKLNARQATEIAKLGLQTRKEERALSHAQQKEINKETKDFYDNTLKENEAAKKSDQRLNRMEKLVNKGDLPISTFYSLFKNMEESVPTTHGAAAGGALGAALGSIVPGLGTVAGGVLGATIGGLISPVGTLLRYAQRKTSPDTEEFEKLSNNFIDQAKAIFGTRITDADLKAFMSTVPTLANTDNGKRAIINNMRVFNKATEIKAKAMKDILKENNGVRPENLPILVEERAKKELDALSEKFETGV